jgi:orotate phosphoribosyltransferase
MTTGTTKVESIEKLKLLGEHEVAGLIIAVDRQERMGDTENIEKLSAAQYIEDVMGLKIFSIQNIKTIYALIKNSLDDDMKKLWLDYYDKYGVEKLE